MDASPHAHIACCVDESAQSRRAVALAGATRRGTGARLSLVHVAPRPLVFDTEDGVEAPAPESLFSRRRRWLEHLAAELEAEPVLLVRATAGDLCRWAEAAGVDLLVVAPHRRGLERLVEGSFSAGILRHARCDVLVTRAGSG